VAAFFPDVDSSLIAHDSERLVYEALRDLPNEYVVLHSFPWLRPMRDLVSEPLREGEADFVLLHPNRGLLVLEVKGGIPELRNRTWFRNDKEIRDPLDQARRNRYALIDAIEERTARKVHRDMFNHGDIVVFPHCTYAGNLPLNVDKRMFLDGRSLSSMPLALDSAWNAWQKRPVALTPNQFSTLVDALMPKLRLLRCSGTDIVAESSRILQITLDQQATLQGLLASDRVLVEGTAGSGKTLLALDFAKSLSSRGDRVLLLCYNKHLAAWLIEQVRSDNRLRNREHFLEISTFHSYAFKLANRAHVDFEVPAENAEQFWDEEVPLVLEQALEVLREQGKAPVFDDIVVDEAQDFSRDWWVTIEGLSRNGRAGRLYVFLDLHQSLRRESRLPPVPLPTRFNLSTNCRNTRAIARSASRLANVEITLLPGSPEGELPSVFRPTGSSADAGLVLAELRRLIRQGVTSRQVVVIGPASYMNGSLARFKEVEDIPLVSEADAWRRGDGILITTARAFKGLEADIVIIYDLTGFGPTFSRTDFYVAWTRARHRLVIVAQSPEIRSLVERSLGESEAPKQTKGSR
jgi:hypothetical protein